MVSEKYIRIKRKEHQRIDSLEKLYSSVKEWQEACGEYNKLGTVESYANVRKTCYKIAQVMDDLERQAAGCPFNRLMDKIEFWATKSFDMPD